MERQQSSELLRGDVPLFEQLLAPEAREAFIDGKRLRMRADDLAELAAYVRSDECTTALNDLASGHLSFGIPRQVKLRKSHSNRRRIIYVYPPDENALLRYVVWGMHLYDDIFSDSLYSFRQQVSVAHVFRKLQRKNYARKLYTVKADIHDYGHSISPELLRPKLEEILQGRDPALLALLEHLLAKDEYLVDGELVRGSMGGLPGVPVGCFFNNVYLMDLDDEMGEMSALYSRYADDIAIFSETREDAEAALARLREIVAAKRLTLNEDKTQLIEPGGSIELLGIQIQEGGLDVADTTKSKAKGKLTHYANKMARWAQRGKISKRDAVWRMARRIDRYFYGTSDEHTLSWRDFFFHVITRPDSLHEIDLCCQDLLRRVATGKRGDARYRFRYEDMRALGYRPLVSSYYSHRKEMAILAAQREGLPERS